MTILLVAANASVNASTAYGTFNPLAMFETSVHAQMQHANSAFNNYGNRGYDFVVAPVVVPAVQVPQQFASLDR